MEKKRVLSTPFSPGTLNKIKRRKEEHNDEDEDAPYRPPGADMYELTATSESEIVSLYLFLVCLLIFFF